MLSKAIKIATVAFEGEYDKGDRPYILHCIRVMLAVEHLGDDYAIVAILHDLVEDTSWTIDDLKKQGFSQEVCTAVECITHIKPEPYHDYVLRVSQNKIATAVKLADLTDNSQISRQLGVTKKDLIRQAKYYEAYYFLQGVNHV